MKDIFTVRILEDIEENRICALVFVLGVVIFLTLSVILCAGEGVLERIQYIFSDFFQGLLNFSRWPDLSLMIPPNKTEIQHKISYYCSLGRSWSV